MPIITYTADEFPSALGPELVGTHSLDVSWAEVIWAAISVGRGRLEHLTQHGMFSIFEMTYRMALIYANLQENPNGTLGRSSAYDGLDPSEKGAISYFLGMTFTKLFLHRLVGVPWLMHLDVYRQQLQPILLGRSKPDFVGLNTSYEWVVVEAKGRTNDYDESVLQRAKIQTQQLSTIQGNQPVLRVGSLVYFSAGVLKFAVRDPERVPRREKIKDLPLQKDGFLSDYYHPLQVLLQEDIRVRSIVINDRDYRVVTLSEFELTVGLSNDLDDRLSMAQPARVQNAIHANQFIGSDGVLIQLGSIWSSEKMRLEPQARARF